MKPSRSVDAFSSFGFLLKDVSRLLSRNFERHSEPLGLTVMHARVLSRIERNEGVSQARLAVLCDADPMTLGRLLQRLEADGLLERRADPKDGRAWRVYLKPRARPVLEEIARLAAIARAEAFKGMAANEIAQFLETLQAVRDNLDALVPGLSDRGRSQARAALAQPEPRTRRKAA